jgi:hypothetical protein
MLHNTLMYVTPCYITCTCYVACYIKCNYTLKHSLCVLLQAVLLAWLCSHHRPRLQNLNMVVDLLKHLSGCWWTGMIMTSQKMLVEREEETVGLPGFISEDIAALLSDLQLEIPAAGDIPGMTVDKAIQVFHVI